MKTILISFLFGASAFACDCAPTANVQRSLAQSASVFTGRVLKVTQGNVSACTDKNKVAFEVDRVFKGVKSRILVVETGTSGSCCGVTFKEGETYLVYARKFQEGLSTNNCTRTAEVSLAKKDLEELGEGEKP